MINVNNKIEHIMDSSKYTLRRVLQTTKYTIVYHAFDEKLKIDVVIKENNGPIGFNLIQNEYNCLRRLNHPNIIKLIDSHIDIDKMSAYIVVEYIEKGDLFNYRIKYNHAFTEQTCIILIKKIIDVLQYCLSSGICHKDIKLENILVRNNGNALDIVLIDFGLSYICEDDEKIFNIFNATGSMGYIAPELLLYNKCNEKCDVWSIGVLLFIILYGEVPFNSNSDIINRQFIFPRTRYVSDEVKDCINKIFTVNPNDRPSLNEITKYPCFEGLN